MLVMAPEGTTGNGRCILQFRTGAFVPGVPVLPVCLTYGKRCHNPAWTIVNEPFHFVRSWRSSTCHKLPIALQSCC
jgi:lysophosphatidylcholine acyltransferase/lyso-PAF acetyltransferase